MERERGVLDCFFRFFISEAFLRVNDRAAEPLLPYSRFPVENKDRAHGESVFSRHQRTEDVRERFGEHWNGPVHQIPRSAPRPRFPVQFTSQFYILRDVGNMNST